MTVKYLVLNFVKLFFSFVFVALLSNIWSSGRRRLFILLLNIIEYNFSSLLHNLWNVLYFMYHFTLLKNQRYSWMISLFHLKNQFRTRNIPLCAIWCSTSTSTTSECLQTVLKFQAFTFNALHKGLLLRHTINICHAIN